jgi:hypothetical protein
MPKDQSNMESGVMPIRFQALLTAALFSLLLLAPLMMPLVRYLTKGWQAKRKDIMDGLNGKARLSYFNMFCRVDTRIESEAEAKTRFEALYTHWYGRRLYIGPGILLGLVGLTACALVTLSVLTERRYLADNPLFQLEPPAIAAIAGAYLWAVNDLISRARRLDLAPANVQLAVLRFVIAVPMGYAFASLATAEVKPFVAFALGAFPLDALTSMLRRLTYKKLDINPEGDEVRDDIVKLQGVNRPIVERLADEDITTVTQIAYCDPVRLVMRSNLTFNFVTDCMNQALVFMYFDGTLEKLRALGMRGAVEIKHLVDDLDRGLDPERSAQQACERAKATLKEMAKILGLEEDAVQVALRQISEDPFTIFLYEIWT